MLQKALPRRHQMAIVAAVKVGIQQGVGAAAFGMAQAQIMIEFVALHRARRAVLAAVVSRVKKQAEFRRKARGQGVPPAGQKAFEIALELVHESGDKSCVVPLWLILSPMT